jgi:hypothetical protein
VARRRGEAVAAAERRQAQACGELGGGGRGREQVERHGCVVRWAGRGGGAPRGNGRKGRCRVQERTAAFKALEQPRRLP